jgi:hydroxymethylglutaryl-CoA lyase
MTQKQYLLVECPRDAMQGLRHWVPTDQKIAYLQALLRVGFDVLDAGSFVSPKAIPQMKDTGEVLSALDYSGCLTRISVVVANEHGFDDALNHPAVQRVGFPLSVSETFQQRNTHRSCEEALLMMESWSGMASSIGKEFMVYLSMGFGNPYGDPYSVEHVVAMVQNLVDLGVGHVALSDTVGLALPVEVEAVYQAVIQQFANLHVGLHLHAHPSRAEAKMLAALDSGCLWVEGALLGYGGCPLANDEMVGNIPSELWIQMLRSKGYSLKVQQEALHEAQWMASGLFGQYH